MNRFHRTGLAALALTFLATAPGLAQSAGPDSTRQMDQIGKKSEAGEIVLDDINIEAKIEKPNVDILPTRVKPEMSESAFIERSFENELKQVPRELMLFDEELDQVKRLNDLIKLLNKKRD